MIQPLRKDEEFLADVTAARGRSPDRLHIWWLGQSGFLVQWRGKHLLLDPYLSDSLTHKYAGTPKPHVRMTERVIEPDRLGFVDVVTSTHNHTDHLDAQTLLPLMRVAPKVKIVVAAANAEFAAKRLEISPDRLSVADVGRALDLDGFSITAVPAAHDQLETDAHGRNLYVGYVIRAGPWTLYHSGDTVVHPELIRALEGMRPDAAILPINGKVGNMNGVDAARLAHGIGAHTAIPCHFEMFEFNTASPAEFVAECERLGQSCQVLRAGERLTLTEAGAS